jgi:hypothetical protein
MTPDVRRKVETRTTCAITPVTGEEHPYIALQKSSSPHIISPQRPARFKPAASIGSQLSAKKLNRKHRLSTIRQTRKRRFCKISETKKSKIAKRQNQKFQSFDFPNFKIQKIDSKIQKKLSADMPPSPVCPQLAPRISRCRRYNQHTDRI